MAYKNPTEQREYQREWMKRRRTAFFEGKQCNNCPSKLNLELHHRNPSEKVTHSIWSWSEVRREEELAKCIILCHDCHRSVTTNQLRKDHPCGITAKYRSGCRCGACVAAYNKYKRLLRYGIKL